MGWTNLFDVTILRLSPILATTEFTPPTNIKPSEIMLFSLVSIKQSECRHIVVVVQYKNLKVDRNGG